jgi:hypothetical protein
LADKKFPRYDNQRANRSPVVSHYQELLSKPEPLVKKGVIEEFIERIDIKKDTIEVTFKVSVVLYGSPKGIRTPVSAVRGRRLRPLDHGATTNII